MRLEVERDGSSGSQAKGAMPAWGPWARVGPNAAKSSDLRPARRSLGISTILSSTKDGRCQVCVPLTRGGIAIALRKVVSIGIEFESDRAHRAHDEGEAEGRMVVRPSLTSTNDEECSGGETRTLNLADSLEEDEYQHPTE